VSGRCSDESLCTPSSHVSVVYNTVRSTALPHTTLNQANQKHGWGVGLQRLYAPDFVVENQLRKVRKLVDAKRVRVKHVIQCESFNRARNGQ
jgi:hypothetical protein